MSKQTSLVTFKGRMGGISFFERKGVAVARKANGPDRSRILNDPKFERTRENMSEFAALTMTTAGFQSIFQAVDNVGSAQLRGRVSSIIRGIIKEHDHLRGKRSVMLSEHRERLLNFETNTESKLEYLFSMQPVTTHSADRLTATVVIDDISKSRIKAPKDTTHIKLVQLAGVLSDIVYNETLKKYEFTDVRLNRLSNVTFSDYIPLNQTEPLTVNLQTTINAVALTSTTTVVQAFGIIFFQKDKSLYYPSKETTAMRVVDVY